MSMTAETLERARRHCNEGEIYCEFCRAVAVRIICGAY